jgi:hypothetical protein
MRLAVVDRRCEGMRGRRCGNGHVGFKTGRDKRFPGDREGRALLKRSVAQANGPFVLLAASQRPFVLEEIEGIARARKDMR